MSIETLKENLSMADTATATAEVTEEKEAVYNGIMITATPEFKAAMKNAADEQDMSISAFARKILAEAINFDGPLQKETSRKRKYATAEEREAAQKARNKTRRDVIKALLEKYQDEVKAAMAEADGDDD